VRAAVLCLVVGVLARGAGAELVAKQITAADTALLFGGADAEGGIGDWYLSNGVVQAIIDDAGVAADLVGIVPAGQEPPMQSQVSPTGGTLIDFGRAGSDGDELVQLFTVGGLATDKFFQFDAVSSPSPGVIRATGKLGLPPLSVPPNLCIGVVTEYSVAGSDPFITLTSTVTNGCAGTHGELGSFLDALIWTMHGIIPFSAGAGAMGGKGFDHKTLDLADPFAAVETPSFVGAPGMLRAEDGVMDPANGTVSNELAYGLLSVRRERDDDGPGGAAPVVTPVDTLFGVTSNLVTAMGILPVGMLPSGGTATYVRRLYVGATPDVRAVGDAIIPELASRLGFATGTLSGDVDAVDTADVAASIVVTRLGLCGGVLQDYPCVAGCQAHIPCIDPIPTPGFGVGGAVTHVRTDESGAFAGVVVPQGVYELLISAPERDDVVVSGVTVGPGDTSVHIPAMTSRGLVAFTVREKAKGRPAIPAKLVFKGADGTPDPRFRKDFSATLGGEDLVPETFAGTQHGPDGSARGQGNVVYTATGTGTIHVRPGTYDVYATRGPEYGVARKRVTVTAGQTAEADFRLKRVIRTKNALASDFHVHSGRSLDTAAPLEDRVVSFAGEGVEVMISTDHDKQVDYTPVIADLGLAARIATIPGVEVTGTVPNPPVFPSSIGHINAWPLPLAKDQRRDGAIEDEFVAPNWVFSRLRKQGGDDVVIQYNHPRASVSGITTIGIFNAIGCSRCANAIDTPCVEDADCPAGGEQFCGCVGFQPDRPLSMPPNDILLDTGILGPGTTPNPNGVRNLDFDLIEVANGAKVGDYGAWLQMRGDWFALLSQNVFKPGTGVSDSHRITVEHAGWSRTYVLGAGDDPAALDVPTFDASVKAGRMVVSAGPWIQLKARGIDKGGPGDTVRGKGGRVRLQIDVRSPAWIPVDEVRIVTIRGFGAQFVEVRSFDAATKPRVKPLPKDFQSSGGTSRFHASIAVQYSGDYLVLVEAGPKLAGGTPVSPEIVNVVEPDVVPLAFTNPIRVDADGNGFAIPAAATVRTGAASGRMTGVTRAARDAAVRRGETFPLYDFHLDPDAARAFVARGGQ
jgi:hypothetical protein